MGHLSHPVVSHPKNLWAMSSMVVRNSIMPARGGMDLMGGRDGLDEQAGWIGVARDFKSLSKMRA